MKEQLKAEVARLEAEHKTHAAAYQAVLAERAAADAKVQATSAQASEAYQALAAMRKALESIDPPAPPVREVAGSGGLQADAASSAGA